jgi:hypothetical protein
VGAREPLHAGMQTDALEEENVLDEIAIASQSWLARDAG